MGHVESWQKLLCLEFLQLQVGTHSPAVNYLYLVTTLYMPVKTQKKWNQSLHPRLGGRIKASVLLSIPETGVLSPILWIRKPRL